MNPASRHEQHRPTRILAAVTAGILLVASSTLGALSASAAPGGYTGSGAGATDFDENDGDRTLNVMVDGESYSDTLTGPQFSSEGTDWCWSVIGDLPGDVELTTDCAPSATFTGVPTAGPFSFQVALSQTWGEGNYTLTFTGTIESSKSPTITTLTAPAVGSYAGFDLSATVVGDPSVGPTPTGTVEFYASGTVLVGSATLVGGVATATGVLDSTNAGGSHGITARYLGDDDYQASTSTSHKVLIFVPTAAGVVMWNGTLVSGATVELLDSTDTAVVVDTDTTDAEGEFEVSPGPITSSSDVNKLYVLRVTHPDSTVLFHKFGGHNVTDIANAERTGPKSWKNYINIERRTAPVWTDAVLATPRVGATYSDAVVAESRNEMYYYVSDGALPAGLDLDEDTGAVSGVPTECEAACAYSFEITGTNGFGSVSEVFTGTVLPAGVAPTWADDEIVGLRAGVATDEGVLADGDPTITYAVTDGELPDGVTLSPSTGALSGTPTTAGPYEFTITATNPFGSITADFEGEVAAAPELALELDFAPGTTIEDAASTISAEGLQVGSTYTLTMFSTPRVLYTGTVGASGGFTWVVALPADTPPGAHRLLLTGTAADGTPMSAQAWFTLGANGRILAISYTGPTGGLAATGSEPWAAALLGGTLLLLGAGAYAGRRRVAVD